MMRIGDVAFLGSVSSSLHELSLSISMVLVPIYITGMTFTSNNFICCKAIWLYVQYFSYFVQVHRFWGPALTDLTEVNHSKSWLQESKTGVELIINQAETTASPCHRDWLVRLPSISPWQLAPLIALALDTLEILSCCQYSPRLEKILWVFLLLTAPSSKSTGASWLSVRPMILLS